MFRKCLTDGVSYGKMSSVLVRRKITMFNKFFGTKGKGSKNQVQVEQNAFGFVVSVCNTTTGRKPVVSVRRNPKVQYMRNGDVMPVMNFVTNVKARYGDSDYYVPAPKHARKFFVSVYFYPNAFSTVVDFVKNVWSTRKVVRANSKMHS